MAECYLFTGGSSCGKSGHAEALLCRKATGRKLYLATMEPFGTEAAQRIARHRAMRAGKGFETAEWPRDLLSFTPEAPVSGILLEDMGNLVANEVFSPEGCPEHLVEHIVEGVDHLSRFCNTLVIVTNETGCDGGAYPVETRRYIQTLGAVNAALAARCHGVARSVCGFLIPLKGAQLF